MNQVASRIDTFPEEMRSRRLDGESRYGVAAVVDMNLSGDVVLPRRNRTDMVKGGVYKTDPIRLSSRHRPQRCRLIRVPGSSQSQMMEMRRDCSQRSPPSSPK